MFRFQRCFLMERVWLSLSFVIFFTSIFLIEDWHCKLTIQVPGTEQSWFSTLPLSILLFFNTQSTLVFFLQISWYNEQRFWSKFDQCHEKYFILQFNTIFIKSSTKIRVLIDSFKHLSREKYYRLYAFAYLNMLQLHLASRAFKLLFSHAARSRDPSSLTIW